MLIYTYLLDFGDSLEISFQKLTKTKICYFRQEFFVKFKGPEESKFISDSFSLLLYYILNSFSCVVCECACDLTYFIQYCPIYTYNCHFFFLLVCGKHDYEMFMLDKTLFVIAKDLNSANN